MGKILKEQENKRWDLPKDKVITSHNEKIIGSANDVFNKTKESIFPGEKFTINKAVYKLVELHKISSSKALYSIHKIHNGIKSKILFLSYITKDKIKKFNDGEKIEVKNEDIYSKDIVDFLFYYLTKNM